MDKGVQISLEYVDHMHLLTPVNLGIILGGFEGLSSFILIF